jgi:tetratricopeptide (TPR) repeat protein
MSRRPSNANLSGLRPLAFAQWSMAGLHRGRVLAALLSGAAILAFLHAPVSPVALSRADAARVAGDPEGAVAAYDAIARLHPVADVRRRALRRAAGVLAGELARPGDARVRLERLARTGLPPSELGAVRDEIGAFLGVEGQLHEASRAYRLAYEADPNAEEAGDRLLAAARAAADAGDLAAAEPIWAQAARAMPERAARVALDRADALLAAGDAQSALTAYRAAVALARDPQLAAVAQLGAAACLERFGALDEALAALDAADLPDALRSSRDRMLRERTSAP